MTDEHGMPQYDGMEYEELVAAAQFLWMKNAKLRELATALEDCRHTTCDDCVRYDYPNGGCYLDDVMHELRIEVK